VEWGGVAGIGDHEAVVAGHRVDLADSPKRFVLDMSEKEMKELRQYRRSDWKQYEADLNRGQPLKSYKQ
jgi:hypothetical protein